MKEENTNPGFPIPKSDSKSLICDFLFGSPKMSVLEEKNFGNRITLFQEHDKRSLSFYEEDLEKILNRRDSKGEEFLQLNFKDEKKIIVTKEFIGFPPAHCVGMSSNQLPKVVTTVDLLNVIDAIESSVYGTEQYQESLRDVRLFFESIASGAEAVGFDLSSERLWVERLAPQKLLN